MPASGKVCSTPFSSFTRVSGGSARDLHVGARKIEHIGRGIDGAKHAVGVKETAFKGCRKTVGKHNLEDVALTDVMLCFFYHRAELFFCEQRLHLAAELPAFFFLLGTVTEQIGKLPEFHHRFVVSDFRIAERHIDNENDFLSDMIKCDDLVKKYQVNILAGFGILGIAAHSRLGVAEWVDRFFSIFITSIGVVKSDRISQLTGSTV